MNRVFVPIQLAFEVVMNKDNLAPSLWKGQLLHFGSLAIFLSLLFFIWDLLERPSPIYFWSAVSFPIIHQVYVWLSWRFELNRLAISRTIGFNWYAVIFFTLFAGRFVSLFLLAWCDRGSVNLPIVPQVVIASIALFLGGYTMYSVKRYFGFARASGIDHFDIRYRTMPFVNKGIFRFTDNGMYLYGFLLFWFIAIYFNSIAALSVTLFSHLYIWVHYYATEKPDMDFIYHQR